MARLWREAEASEALQQGGGIAELTELVPELPPSDHIQHREALAEINRRYLLGPTEPTLPEGGGLRGHVKRRIVRLAAEVVHTMLDRYFGDERELLINLVRFQNELAKKSDRVEDELRSVAVAIRDELRAVKVATPTELHVLSERMDALHRLVEERLDRLETRG